MLLRGGLISLAFHNGVGDKCDACINMDLVDNAGGTTLLNLEIFMLFLIY